MKKLVILLALLLLPAYTFAATGDAASVGGKAVTAISTINGKTGSGLASICGKNYTDGDGGCTSPAGDVTGEGFESGTPANWTSTGTVAFDYALSGLSGGAGATENCTYGLKLTYTTANTWGQYDVGLGNNIAHPYIKFSFYIDSTGIQSGHGIPLLVVSSAANQSDWMFGVRMVGTGSGTYYVDGYSDSANSSDSDELSNDTWYYVQVDGSDAGTCTISIGTTYGGTQILNATTWTCENVTSNPRYFTFGPDAGWEEGATIIYGYVAIDDDGTF